ncbi:MAG: hypothetical protein FWG99_07900 [Treponema sp.]|nr:hypothetical protein [Treponema sp.]
MKTKKAILIGLITVLVTGGSVFCVESEQIVQAPIRENGIVRVYRAIENGVVSGYRAIENGVVSGYKAIETKFVNAFLTPKHNSAIEDGVTVSYNAIENGVAAGVRAVEDAFTYGERAVAEVFMDTSFEATTELPEE